MKIRKQTTELHKFERLAKKHRNAYKEQALPYLCDATHYELGTGSVVDVLSSLPEKRAEKNLQNSALTCTYTVLPGFVSSCLCLLLSIHHLVVCLLALISA